MSPIPIYCCNGYPTTAGIIVNHGNMRFRRSILVLPCIRFLTVIPCRPNKNTVFSRPFRQHRIKSTIYKVFPTSVFIQPIFCRRITVRIIKDTYALFSSSFIMLVCCTDGIRISRFGRIAIDINRLIF